MLYDSNPSNPDAEDIVRVTDYIVAYACKGTETIKEEKAQIRGLVLAATEEDSCSDDVKRLARQVLNRSVGQKLVSKQECMVLLADLCWFECSECFEHVSLGG